MGGSSSSDNGRRVVPPAARGGVDSLNLQQGCALHRHLSQLSPLTRNLLSNHNANDGLSHWEVDHGGDGWAVVETGCCHVGAGTRAFSSSFEWCTKWQVIDLLAEGFSEEELDEHQPEICISDWYAPHPSFGGEYEIHVKLMTADRRLVIDEFKEGPLRLPRGHAPYQQISHIFRRYGRGVRFVHFLHKGKDILFWTGHYGARLTNSSVTVMSRRQLVQQQPFLHQTSSSTVRFWMDLDPLPDELLLHILSFVPAQDLLLQCRAVCRRWQSLVDTSTLWLLKFEREQQMEMLQLANHFPSYAIPWSLVYVKKPFNCNLLRNACGKEGMRYWHAKNGGRNWSLEDNRTHVQGAEAQTCFVSTYYWCEKWQMVDLLQKGLWQELLDHHQPEICISDWYGGRQDCGCVYEIYVKLLASDGKRVIHEYEEKPERIPQWNNEEYHQAHTTNVEQYEGDGTCRAVGAPGLPNQRFLCKEWVIARHYMDSENRMHYT
ncbi:uncharacterized protein [Ambystoma mexicanum]|uniref:uncharacterized protein isoform X2 n=1 Tax=Ambystoma mexicanum TaxID=8296 RepID=UPI0037E9B100